jgi:non-haem Fe2+, alpha-ketoglutarate-dependent halogenase
VGHPTEYVPRADDGRDLRFRPADPDAARTLTPEQVEEFNERGFLRPLPVFGAADADRIRAYTDGLLDAVVNAPDPRNAYSINGYHLVCRGLYDLIVTPRILDYVQDLIGPDIVCWGSHLFAKLPGDPMEVPLHQDAVYWPLTPTWSVSAWLAIDDVDEENGAMQLVPGSHRLGALDHVVKPLDGTRVLKRQVEAADSFVDRVSDSLGAGEISLHSDLLLHGSHPNTSDRRRAGITFRYAAAPVRFVAGAEWWGIPALHCRGTIPEHWPNCARPASEQPDAFATVWGDFDGNPVPDAG